jgi:hypothetical protein
MNSTASVTHEKISQRAHQLWEQAGRPAGSEVDHWLRAERELQQDQGKKDSRNGSVEPPPKHVVSQAPHSAPYAPTGVTTDSLHHQRKR